MVQVCTRLYGRVSAKIAKRSGTIDALHADLVRLDGPITPKYEIRVSSGVTVLKLQLECMTRMDTSSLNSEKPRSCVQLHFGQPSDPSSMQFLDCEGDSLLLQSFLEQVRLAKKASGSASQQAAPAADRYPRPMNAKAAPSYPTASTAGRMQASSQGGSAQCKSNTYRQAPSSAASSRYTSAKQSVGSAMGPPARAGGSSAQPSGRGGSGTSSALMAAKPGLGSGTALSAHATKRLRAGGQLEEAGSAESIPPASGTPQSALGGADRLCSVPASLASSGGLRTDGSWPPPLLAATHVASMSQHTARGVSEAAGCQSGLDLMAEGARTLVDLTGGDRDKSELRRPSSRSLLNSGFVNLGNTCYMNATLQVGPVASSGTPATLQPRGAPQ